MKFVTPEEYYKIQQEDKRTKFMHTLKHLRRMARNKQKCELCGQPAWKLGDCGMCFPCTTGESDSSNDYELYDSSNDYELY